MWIIYLQLMEREKLGCSKKNMVISDNISMGVITQKHSN